MTMIDIRIPLRLAPLAILALGNGASGMADGADVAIQPGEWEMTFQTLDIKVPNQSPPLFDAMKSRPIVNRTCVTPEQARQPQPQVQAGCSQEGFDWSAGHVAGTVTCAPARADGTVMVVVVDGRYSATSMDMELNSKVEMKGSSMTWKARLTGRRIGECGAGTQIR